MAKKVCRFLFSGFEIAELDELTKGFSSDDEIDLDQFIEMIIGSKGTIIDQFYKQLVYLIPSRFEENVCEHKIIPSFG